jgi:glucosylceramidase
MEGGTSNGTAVLQYTCGAAQGNQEWQFQSVGNGYYQLVNRNALIKTGKNLVWGVAGATSVADGAQIILWTYGAASNQQWMPVPLGNGAFKFVDRSSSKCLGTTVAIASKLQQYGCSESYAQSYVLKQK